MEDKAKHYLEYLDKEMTIMGILSAFCVAVPSLILERVTSAKGNYLAELWFNGYSYLLIASILMFISAALFYKQRSLLAFYYGRISIGTSPVPNDPKHKMIDWVDYADSWVTWIPYNSAFWIGACAALEYVFAFLSLEHPYIKNNFVFYSIFSISFLIIILVLSIIVMKDRSIRFGENPWIEYILKLFTKE